MSRKKNKLRESLKNKIKSRNQEKAADRKGSSALHLTDGLSLIDVKKGTRYFDIIPYEVQEKTNPSAKPGEFWYERTYFRHGRIGTENKNVVCPLKTVGTACPICEHRNILLKDYNKNEEEIKATRPSERQIFNVIDVEKPNDKIQILDMSYFCFGEVLDTELLEDDELGAFADLEGGNTLKVRFKSESIGTFEFPKASRIDFETRDDYEDSIVEEAADLESLLNIIPYKELKALFFETGEEEPEEEAKPTRRRGRKKAEEEEPEEEPEEEAKPTRRRGRKKAEEEEPEEEPEEEEFKLVQECPHGFVWGESNNSHDKCIDCNHWEECADEQEFIEKNK